MGLTHPPAVGDSPPQAEKVMIVESWDSLMLWRKLLPNHTGLDTCTAHRPPPQWFAMMTQRNVSTCLSWRTPMMFENIQ
jgi:hypothetical protein